MNARMVRILVRKDLHLVAAPALGYLAAGTLALGMMAMPGQGFYYAGVVLLITALMALGFHPAIMTAAGERKGQTLAFVMSMPITPADYTVAKLAVNLLVFFVPWTLLLAGCAAVIHAMPSLPDGMIPLAVILFGVIGASAVVILCVALVTESMGLTILVQVASNMAFQGVIYSASNHPVIKAQMTGDAILWSGPVLAYLGAYVAIACSALAAAVWRQSRKTAFF
jgi:ABC-2 type transport system permease protein